jgi:carbonic anhydrase
MEVHFVHEAADGSKAVVGILTEDGADNEALAKILANRPRNGKTIEGCNADLDLRALVSVNETSFHYQGSLTTPPCSEGLQWWVMTQRITINREQRERYASLFPTETNRPVQSLNGRTLEMYTDPAQ